VNSIASNAREKHALLSFYFNEMCKFCFVVFALIFNTTGRERHSTFYELLAIAGVRSAAFQGDFLPVCFQYSVRISRKSELFNQLFCASSLNTPAVCKQQWRAKILQLISLLAAAQTAVHKGPYFLYYPADMAA